MKRITSPYIRRIQEIIDFAIAMIGYVLFILHFHLAVVLHR